MQLSKFIGALVLDNSMKQAFLLQNDQNGNPILPPTLMMSDPSPSGNFDPLEITVAFRFFSAIPNAGNRPAITVFGFSAVTPAAVPVIHVVRA